MIADCRYCGTLLMAASCGVLLSVRPADAQQIQRPNPSTAILATPPQPEAADNGLGMAMLGAVLNSDGTTFKGSGLTSASRFGTGGYTINFDRSIADCMYAVVSRANGIFPKVVVAAGNNIQVNMNKSTDNLLTDGGFSLVVYCPK